MNKPDWGVSTDTSLRCEWLVRSESSGRRSTEMRQEYRTQRCAVMWGWKNRERDAVGRKANRRGEASGYIPPRRHVAQTQEDQPPSLAKFPRQGQVYYTVVLMHRLFTLHSISLQVLHNTSYLMLLWWLFDTMKVLWHSINAIIDPLPQDAVCFYSWLKLQVRTEASCAWGSMDHPVSWFESPYFSLCWFDNARDNTLNTREQSRL